MFMRTKSSHFYRQLSIAPQPPKYLYDVMATLVLRTFDETDSGLQEKGVDTPANSSRCGQRLILSFTVEQGFFTVFPAC